MTPLNPAPGKGQEKEKPENLRTRQLAKMILTKLYPMLDRVYRSHRYRHAARVEEAAIKLLELSIEAPRARTITKAGALVDTIDLLHDLLEIGQNLEIINNEGKFLASIYHPKTDDHPGGELWQLSALSSAMLKNLRAERDGKKANRASRG